MKPEDFITRVDELLGLAVVVTASICTVKSEAVGTWSFPNQQLFSELLTASLSFAANIFGEAHPYSTKLSTIHGTASVAGLNTIHGILRAMKGELADGWLRTTRELVSAELFGDFLEMAEHLSEEGYKDAAAVIAGSSLEAHLRRLTEGANLPTTFTNSSGDVVPRKAESLNQELARTGVYDKNEQKQVTTWLGIRNDAAHGNYANVDPGMVRLMMPGIRHFISRHPA